MNRSFLELAQPRDHLASARTIAVLASLVVLGTGIGLQGGLIKLPTPQQGPIAPAATATATSTASALASPSPALATSPRPDTTFTAPDASFEVRLSTVRWDAVGGADPTALYLRHDSDGREPTKVSIRIGDPDGRVLMCDRPALTWDGAEMERCEVAVATSVEELVDATGFPTFDSHARVLDGEPAVSVHKAGYQWPAHGGQFIAYVLAMHDARPVVVRFWTGSEEGFVGVDEILDGFRFLD